MVMEFQLSLEVNSGGIAFDLPDEIIRAIHAHMLAVHNVIINEGILNLTSRKPFINRLKGQKEKLQV